MKSKTNLIVLDKHACDYNILLIVPGNTVPPYRVKEWTLGSGGENTWPGVSWSAWSSLGKWWKENHQSSIMSGPEMSRIVQTYCIEEEMVFRNSIFHRVFSKYCSSFKRIVSFNEDGVIQVSLHRCGDCAPCRGENGSVSEGPAEAMTISRKVVIKE